MIRPPFSFRPRPKDCRLLALCCLLSSAAHAAGSTAPTQLIPFDAGFLNPLTQIYGVNTPAIPRVLPAGAWEIQLQQEIANSYSIQRDGDELALIDGELWRTSLGLGYQLAPAWRVDLRLPYIRHTGGMLDGLISDWHDGLSLPNGDRELRPQDKLEYRYLNDELVLRHGSEGGGLGDLRLATSYVQQREGADLMLSATLKLPTGDSDELRGSGATDISLSAAFSDASSLTTGDVRWFGGVGLNYLGDSDLPLARKQRNWVWTTRLGGGWQFHPAWQFKAQLDHHSSVYHSRTRALGDAGFQLTAGVSWQATEELQLDLALSEDLATTVTPDISLLLAMNCLL